MAIRGHSTLFLLLWRHRDCFIGGLCGSQWDPCQFVTLTVFLTYLQLNQPPLSLFLSLFLSLCPSVSCSYLFLFISLYLEQACGKAVESWKLFSLWAASVGQARRRCLPMFTRHRSHTSLTYRIQLHGQLQGKSFIIKYSTQGQNHHNLEKLTAPVVHFPFTHFNTTLVKWNADGHYGKIGIESGPKGIWGL